MDYIQKNLFLKSAEKMTQRQQYVLGHQYLKGEGVEKDEDLGIRLLLLAYKNDKKQICALANALCLGDGFPKDVKRGISILTQLSNEGNADADYLLGNVYNGRILETVDPKKAFYHYEKASKKNHTLAIHNLGTCYQNGNGVEIDYAKAIECYNKSKKMGCVQSSINLGSMYEMGLGVEQDYDKALKLYLEGCKIDDNIAYYNVGNMYYQGMGRPKDFKKAYQYLTKGASLGSPDCKFVLGIMYQNGEGVDINYDKARIYYEEAVRGGVVVANNNLATLYKNGLGVEASNEKAYKYIKTAADQGCMIGKLNMAMAYIAGLGIEKDLGKAKDILEEFVDDPSLGIASNYLVGKLYQQLNGAGSKDVANYKKIIDSFLKSYSFYSNNLDEENVLGVGDYVNSTYACFDCIELAATYLEMCYLEEANTEERTAVRYRTDNKYKTTARQFLNTAISLRDYVLDTVKDECDNDIKLYRGLLDDTSDNISKLTYEEFREKYYGKYPRLFLITQKKEYEIYEDGIKLYFDKRTSLETEIDNRKSVAKEEFDKSRPLIRKMLEAKGLSEADIENKIQELEINKTTIKQSVLDVDYSNSVSNIDKYLEEILHGIFVDGFFDYSQEKGLEKIDSLVAEASNEVGSISENLLVKLTKILNNIDDSVALDRSVREKQLKRYLGFFRGTKVRKNLAESKIDTIKDYMIDNAIDLEGADMDLLNKIVSIYDARQEINNLSKDDKFELGRLYHLAYIETDALMIGPAHKELNESFVKFVKDINSSMEEDKIRLKLSELLLKVEMFRVMVRNVASHKAKLNQTSVEDGINICIAQENSIFHIIDELFGDYLNNRYAKKMIDELGI